MLKQNFSLIGNNVASNNLPSSKKKMKKFVCFLLSFAMFVLFTGCKKEVANEQTTENTPTVQVQQNESLPWESVKFDYSYFETDRQNANQYLTNENLNLQDLKNIHDIANIVYGEYREFFVYNKEKITPELINDVIDNELFLTEQSKRYTVKMIFNLSYKKEYMENAPYVRIIPEHIGEKGDYLYVPVMYYEPHINPNDIEWHDWVNEIMILKRDSTSKYGWKFCIGIYTPGTENGPWFSVEFSDGDFSDEARKSIGNYYVDDDFWQYYIGNTKKLPELSISNNRSYYDNQSAAAYSYNYAYNYNSAYFDWSYWNSDCANFASQCLVAGGLPQDNVWQYYYNSSDPIASGTSSWRGASNLYYYIINYSKGGHVPIAYLLGDCNNIGYCVIRWGDLLYLDDPSQHHMMIFTHTHHITNNYYNGTPKYTLSAHTTDRRDWDILNISTNYLTSYAKPVHITYWT